MKTTLQTIKDPIIRKQAIHDLLIRNKKITICPTSICSIYASKRGGIGVRVGRIR
jgi:hypothetical protein